MAALGGKSAEAIGRVFEVAERLNGIGADQVDAAKKNLSSDPNASSSSASA